MNQTKADEIRQRVRSAYSEVAEASDSGGCCGEASSCCGVSDDVQINALISTRLGYSREELDTLWDLDRLEDLRRWRTAVSDCS